MEITQLQSFLEAADSGSFRKAARALYLSQPSLSGRIRALERELRAPLFHRLSRGVRLTEAGEAFRPFVERALETLQQGTEAVRTTQESQRRTITIGSARIIGTYVLPQVLERFQPRYPRVSARIRTGRSSDVMEMVANGVVDIGLSRGIRHHDLFSIHIYDEPIVLATYPDHPFARRGRAYLSEVARQPLILYDPSSTYFQLINQACREAGIVPQIETMLDNIEATKRMVALGLGISFLPHSAILTEIEQGTLRHIQLQGDRQVYLPTHVLVRRAQHYSAPVVNFLKLLREIYGCDISPVLKTP